MTFNLRLIDSPPQSGIMNMAIDHAIMQAIGVGEAPPTLRFYAWQPACLSLGYTQRSRDADFERIEKLGWDVVRRPTGGRAILHTDELTYSICFPQEHELVKGDILSSYRRLSVALQNGLERVGLSSQAQPYDKNKARKKRLERKSKRENSSPVCFETPQLMKLQRTGAN